MDEQSKAQLAKEEEISIFDRIVKREIPANIIFEDEMVSRYSCSASRR